MKFCYFLLICLLSGCTVVDIATDTLSTEDPQPLTQQASLVPSYPLPMENLSTQEISAWVLADLYAVYTLSYEQNYLQWLDISPEELEARQISLLLPQVQGFLEKLWSEYPSEENQAQCLAVLQKFYQSLSISWIFTEFDNNSGEYLITIEVCPLALPSHFVQNYYQENFNALTEGVVFTKLSQENYELYDQTATKILLEELEALEEIPTSDPVELTLILTPVEGGYLLANWSAFHNLISGNL